METTSFRARSVAEAVAAVKAALGPDAVVVKTRAVTTPRGDREIEVIAGRSGKDGPRITKPLAPGGSFAPITWGQSPAHPASAPSVSSNTLSRPLPPGPGTAHATTPSSVPQHTGESRLLAEFASLRRLVRSSLSNRPGVSVGLPPLLASLLDRLLGQGADLETAESVVQKAREALTPQETRDENAVRHAALVAVEAMLPPAAEVPASGTRIALVGSHGSGKTTTIAKMAAAAKFRRGQTVALISLDRHKVGGAEQLRSYADALDVPFHAATTKGQLADCMESIHADVTLIDTPGMTWRSGPNLAALADVLTAAAHGCPEGAGIETHLVLPCSSSGDTLRVLSRAFAVLAPTHHVLTRLDEAPALGGLLGMLDISKPLSAITAGPNVPDDYEPASPAALARRILGTGFAE